MKNMGLLLFTFLLWMSAQQMSAQCTPDPGCVDDTVPGQICPASLPDGTISSPYSQVLTIIPPSSADLPLIGTVTITKIVLTSIANLPPGISFQSNSTGNIFMVGTKYCVLLSGTPTDTGTYHLIITAEAYFTFLGIPTHQPYSDSTTYSIKIKSVNSDVAELISHEHFFVPELPNPFTSSDKIRVNSYISQPLALHIFNCFGQKVYEEKSNAVTGDYYFNFNGAGFSNGIYIYSISNGNRNYTGRLILTYP